jgi:hypothetical protein
MILDINLAARLSAQDEDQLLNHIWMGLLGVEALMVLGVALRAVASSRLFAGAAVGRRNSMKGLKVAGAAGVDNMGVIGEYYDGEGYWVRE